MNRPSHATVVAYLALFVAIGGTAVALPGKNTVDSGDIVRGQVRSSDLQDNGVRSRDVRDDELRSEDVLDEGLTGDDVAPNSLAGGDIAEGSLGTVPSAEEADYADSIGAGSVHPFNFTTITRRTASVSVAGGGTAENGNYDTETVGVNCLAGEMALTGGAYWLTTAGADVAADSELWLSMSYANYDGATSRPTGWRATGGNDTGTAHTLWVHVFCLAP
jgi:hypothetical protein